MSENEPHAAAGPPLWKRIFQRLLVYLIVAAVTWYLGVYLIQRKVIYPAPTLTAAQRQTPSLPPSAQEMDIKTAAGTVQGWFLKGKGVSDARPGPAVIYAHGNGELIDDWLHQMHGYTSRGVSVLLAEYPGYGRSAGSPSQTSLTNAFVKFYDKLKARPDVDTTRIVFHGRSLGGGVIAQLAARRQPAAMILQSTFTSLTAVAMRFGAPPWLIRDPYSVRPVIRHFKKPLLIIGGSKDRILPVSYSRQLHAADVDSQLIILPIGHNDPPPEPEYWDDIAGFLKKAHIIKR